MLKSEDRSKDSRRGSAMYKFSHREIFASKNFIAIDQSPECLALSQSDLPEKIVAAANLWVYKKRLLDHLRLALYAHHVSVGLLKGPESRSSDDRRGL